MFHSVCQRGIERSLRFPTAQYMRQFSTVVRFLVRQPVHSWLLPPLHVGWTCTMCSLILWWWRRCGWWDLTLPLSLRPTLLHQCALPEIAAPQSPASRHWFLHCQFLQESTSPAGPDNFFVHQDAQRRSPCDFFQQTRYSRCDSSSPYLCWSDIASLKINQPNINYLLLYSDK